jgi:hypothetical protein
MNSFMGKYFVKTRNIETVAAWSVNAAVWPEDGAHIRTSVG